MTNTGKSTNTNISVNPPITLFAGDPLSGVLNKAFIKTIPGGNLGAFISSLDIAADSSVDLELATILDDLSNDTQNDTGDQSGGDDGSSQDKTKPKLKAPTISDIAVLGNTVTYDNTGKPYVTLLIRVFNSSGVQIKGVKAKVGKQ